MIIMSPRHDKKTFYEMPRWTDLLKIVPTTSKRKRKQEQEKNVILRERLKLPWSEREGGFWLTARGDRFFEEIKEKYLVRHGTEKYIEYLNDLEDSIDVWNDEICSLRAKHESFDKYRKLSANVLRRDKHKCLKCNRAKAFKPYMLTSLSEQLACYLRRHACKIGEVDMRDNCFYDMQNLVALCYGCYDFHVDVSLMKGAITGLYEEPPNRQKEHFRLGALINDTRKKLEDKKFRSKNWFVQRLEKIRSKSHELINSSHETGMGLNSLLGVNMLLRIGKYDQAKRAALRVERYWQQESSERSIRDLKKIQLGSFVKRNWETVLMRSLDKLISRYKEGNYSIPYEPPNARYSSSSFKEIFRDAENEIRAKMGVPLIGEGWIAETEVFCLVKDILSEYKVIHHARPKWLDRQEFDIYVPELRMAIEYMGQQHYKPVEFFGGKEAFKVIKELDARKLKKAIQKKCRILYVRYDEDMDRESLRKKIISLIRE